MINTGSRVSRKVVLEDLEGGTMLGNQFFFFLGGEAGEEKLLWSLK